MTLTSGGGGVGITDIFLNYSPRDSSKALNPCSLMLINEYIKTPEKYFCPKGHLQIGASLANICTSDAL